jgi:hypothetical protein
MGRIILTMGAWLLAAPLLLPQTPLAAAELLRYSLDETPAQLVRWLGPPVQIADSDAQFVTWYYQTDVQDLHEHSHLLVFRKSDGKLTIVTRNFHLPVQVDALFPAAKSNTYYWPSEGNRQWSVRVRILGEDRLAIAMGTAKAGDTTTQVVILRRAAVRVFLPWLHDQLLALESTTQPSAANSKTAAGR